MKQIVKIFVSCLPLFCAIVCIYGILYFTMQQYIRLSANEIPMQYAMETKTKLESGLPLSVIIMGINPTDMKKSIAPFIIVCDSVGKVKNSSVTLQGHIPAPPIGVFDAARRYGENRLTWQPWSDVRNAIVILPYSINSEQGYVIGGQSLRETEDRERFLLGQIAFGILLTLSATFITTIISGLIRTK